MTLIEKYKTEDRWYAKVILMEVYHLVNLRSNSNWTVSDTAHDFNVSIGLASENLRIAEAMHKNDKLINCKTRQLALDKIK